MREGTAVAGRYRLLEQIGAGGMGEVWRATDEVLKRTVAIKVVLPSLQADPDFVRRFLSEARAMASVHHPGVVAIHDFGEVYEPNIRPSGERQGGRIAYLVMEYVAGESLSRVLRRVGRLDPSTTMNLVNQIARALQAVHDRGIVHRDIKPGNLIVRPDGAVALADFGIAAALDATAWTQPGMILGTPSYLAPEQVLGQPASPRSDVYALGLVAYECLAGRRPFMGDDPLAVAMQRVQYAPPPLPPDVPPPVAEVVARALATDPAHRWPTAAEFAAAAGRVGGGARVSSVPGRTVRMGAPSRRRRRGAILVTAALVLLAAGAAALWSTQDPGSPDASGPSGTGQDTGGAQTSPGGQTSGGQTSGGQGGGGGQPGPAPAGFSSCGDLFCPAEPMCWRGLTSTGFTAEPPAPANCTAPHRLETFAATPLTLEVTPRLDMTTLIEREEFAAICSAATMAERSLDPADTQGWIREAWPIPQEDDIILVHCLARPSEGGEYRGTFFRSGIA